MYLRAILLLSVLINCNVSYAQLFEDEVAKKERAKQQEQIKAQEAHIIKLEEMHSQAIVGLHNKIQKLRHDISELNGQIEVLVNDIALSQNRQKDFYIDLDSRLRRIEQPDAVSNNELNIDSSTVEVPSPTSVAIVSDDENSSYQEAFNMFKIGRFKGAISKFKSFIENYPESNLVPSSHYWIGNSYYAMRDFKRAIFVQQELIKGFPESAKVPDAMLNIASSQKEINFKTEAKKTLTDLIERYPTSDAAEKAKKRLDN
tara:strand:- start:12595 stop:13371 length:777 start_codon:yes stop_codon:yes gene_type:complete